MQALIGRLVKVDRFISFDNGNSMKMQRGYGRIIQIDTNRKEPFRILCILDNGFELDFWTSGYNLEVIR